MGDIPQLLTLALTSHAPKVIDADAITHLGEPERLRGQDAILTPHEGEFERLFGKLGGSKAERALEGARKSGAVIVFKGPDTLVASPDGRLGFAPPAPAWLASARDRRCAGRDDRRDCGRGGSRLSKRPAPRSGFTGAPPNWQDPR